MDKKTVDKEKSSVELNSQEENSYRFMFETAKKRPINYRKYLIRTILIIGAALLFGTIAAVVFVKVTDYIRDDEAKQELVVIESDPLPVDELDSLPEKEESVPEVTVVPESSEGAVGNNFDVNALTTDQLGNLQKKIYQAHDQYYEHLAEYTERSIVKVIGVTVAEDWLVGNTESRSETTGIIVASDSNRFYVLVNTDPINNAASIQAELYNEKTVELNLIKKDEATGLGVFELRKDKLSAEEQIVTVAAELGNSYNVRRGDTVIAVGSPMGYSDSVIFGNVTSKTNTVKLVDAQYNIITTDIHSGENGSGVLINTEGEVVGVIMQKYLDPKVVEAVPISQIKKLIEKLSNCTGIAYLGIIGEDVTNNISINTGIPVGVYVNSVVENSPAFASGIQNGDIIVKINGKQITNMDALRLTLNQTAAGGMLNIEVKRAGPEGYTTIPYSVVTGTI